MTYYISEEIANAIISEIKAILNYHINIIDINGIIIASTNENRVGDFHEGANKLIKNKEDILTVKAGSKLEGVKEGINLPIKLKENIIGVIGITGVVEEILPYGKIIQKLIEIFLLKNYDEQQFRIDEIKREKFVKKWLSKKFSMPKEIFESEMKKFKLNKSNLYTVILFYFNIEDENKEGILHKCFDIINTHIEKTKNIAIINKHFIILVSSLQENNTIELSEKIIHINKKTIEHNIFCGIGASTNYQNLNASYFQAKKALSLSKKKNCIVSYTNSVIRIAIDSIDQRLKIDIKNKYLNTVSKKEEEDIKEFVNTYCKNNGSISSIAEYENIHKNTVQYRIQKINDTTNMDIRNIHDFFILYLLSILEIKD